jgi:hypothetical protein
MNKKKKEITLLIVLIPVMVFFIFQAVTGSKKKDRPVRDPGVVSGSEESAIQSPSAMPDSVSDQSDLFLRSLSEPGPEELAREEISRDALAEKSWSRDPFLPVVKKVKKDPMADIRLQGIVWHPTGATAIIGGKIYRVGDAFRGITVKEITRDTVLLEKAGREIILKMSDGR